MIFSCLDLREGVGSEHPVRPVSQLHRSPRGHSQVEVRGRLHATCHAMRCINATAQVRQEVAVAVLQLFVNDFFAAVATGVAVAVAVADVFITAVVAAAASRGTALQ